MDINTKTDNMANNKGRILFVITKSNFGGAQRYVFELASRLKSTGHDIAVALGGNGLLKTKLEELNIKVYQMEDAQRDIKITKEFKVLWRLFKIMKEFKPESVHLNSPKIGGLGALAARMTGVKKIIYTNHGWPFRESRPEWQLVVIRLLSWLTVFLGKKTIVLSQTERDLVKNWVLVQEKFVVIPNGLSEFDLLSKEASLKLLLGDEKAEKIINENWLTVGTISELHKNKGINFALEGLSQYIDHVQSNTGTRPNILYIVIGEGEQRKNIEKIVVEKNLKQNVFLAGSVDDARRYLRAFDIFLLSSIKEGLPYAILEAGFAKLPVISTSVGGIPELIENFNTGLLIPPGRPSEIKNALIYINEHEDLKPKIASNLYTKVTTNYSFEQITSEIEKLY